ncbi:MAG: AMP-binding protein [Mycobacterium sp.]|nr:AMP-binding protein [Mycobacterium sp.]
MNRVGEIMKEIPPVYRGRTAAQVDLRMLRDNSIQEIPFYRDRIDGVNSCKLADIPSFRRNDLPQQLFPLSNPNRRLWSRVFTTSGTRSAPLLVAFAERDLRWHRRLLAEIARRAAIGPDDVLVNTHGQGTWVGGPALNSLAMVSGAALIGVGPGRTEQTIRILTDVQPTAISATPSYLRKLVDRAREVGIDPAGWNLRVGFIGGEPAPRDIRENLCRLLGPRFHWHELYGLTENGGPILGHCPQWAHPGGVLALNNRRFAVELLSLDSDQPAEPGEQAEIAITTIARTVTPLLRYRTGDLTRLLGTDPTGRPVVSSIRSRIDEGLKIRGALVFPAAIEDAIVAVLGADREWRVDIHRSEPGEDVLAITAESDRTDAERVGVLIREHIGVRPEVSLVGPWTLERFEHKARRVVDHRKVTPGGRNHRAGTANRVTSTVVRRSW